MRTVTFGGANSLDNYLARPDDAADWILWSGETAALMGDYWKTIDTILMGRKTYEVALRHSEGGEVEWGMQTYVFSRTLTPGSQREVTIVSSDAVEFVRALKGAQGKGICLMGGGEFARAMFEADLVDEIRLNIHPLLLGAGVPLFHPMNRQIDLELLESRPFKNGCVLVRYGVKR